MNKYVDIAVIGTGPAGLTAARVAARAGGQVLLLERDGWTGGRLGLQVQPPQGPRTLYRGLNGVTFCQRLLDEAVSGGAEILLNTAVSGIIRHGTQERPHLSVEGTNLTLTVTRLADDPRGGPPQTVVARRVILATGSWEPRLEFNGSELPGVILSGEAQVMTQVRGVLPGRRAVMIGSDNAGLLIASNVLAAGVEIAAVVDESPRILGARDQRGTSSKPGRRYSHVNKAGSGPREGRGGVGDCRPVGLRRWCSAGH